MTINKKNKNENQNMFLKIMFPKIYYKNSLIEIYYYIRQVHPPPTFGLLIKDYTCKISSFPPHYRVSQGIILSYCDATRIYALLL